MIPKIIWQTYESDYKDLGPKTLECSLSWQNQNKDWEYKYVSAQDRETFVLDNFGNEWLKIYKSYKVNVLRATLWRYMCLYVYGGFYSDIDMVCKKPIDEWLDLNLDFAVSKEPGNPGLTQMIFASAPQSIFLKNMLNDIKNIYYFNKETNKVYDNIVDYSIYQTGYITFTKSIFKTIEENNLDNFIVYTQKDAAKIHNDYTKHYRAGINQFDKNYVSWHKENYL
jgi:mannosyltransferase OCH1-like enzyme